MDVVDDETRDLYEPPVREILRRDGTAVVRLSGELDLHNAAAVRAAMRDAERLAARVVVDLADVSFIDSTALGVLVETRARLGRGTSFAIAAPGPDVRRTLAVSGLDRHFAVHGTVDEAVEAG